MNGRIAAGIVVLSAVVAGVAVWWFQVHAFYREAAFPPGEGIRLAPVAPGPPEVIAQAELTGIDADSSPLRFRACLTTSVPLATLTETYRPYPEAVPLVAPGWFGCFDAVAIGRALERGEALAFLSEPGIAPGVDRVLAVFPDGRAFAWHQLQGE